MHIYIYICIYVTYMTIYEQTLSNKKGEKRGALPFPRICSDLYTYIHIDTCTCKKYVYMIHICHIYKKKAKGERKNPNLISLQPVKRGPKMS